MRRLVGALQFEFLARSDQNTAKWCQATALQKLLLNSVGAYSEIHVDKTQCLKDNLDPENEWIVQKSASRSALRRMAYGGNDGARAARPTKCGGNSSGPDADAKIQPNRA